MSHDLSIEDTFVAVYTLSYELLPSFFYGDKRSNFAEETTYLRYGDSLGISHLRDGMEVVSVALR